MRAANGPAALVRPPAIGTALRELAALRFSQLCAGSRNAVPLNVLLDAELAGADRRGACVLSGQIEALFEKAQAVGKDAIIESVRTEGEVRA
jgi:hypothetical protein